MTTILIVLIVLFAIVLLLALIPLVQSRRLTARRVATMRSMERSRGSKVITLIHRLETITLIGIPLRRYIDIEDSEQLLQAIRLTPAEKPIDLVVHTPGGAVLAAEQIARALKRHAGKVTVFVPHYAMSGGTMVALAAGEVVMDPDAVLGPVDPQLGRVPGGFFPAASIVKALETDNPNRDDETLILGDMARKALEEIHDTVYFLVKDRMPEDKAKALAELLSCGRWTHDHPIGFDQAKSLGFPVSDKMPPEVHRLMELYPQTGRRRRSVEFLPEPNVPRTPPRR